MKKRTNTILVVTFIVILIINITMVSIFIYRYNRGLSIPGVQIEMSK